MWTALAHWTMCGVLTALALAYPCLDRARAFELAHLHSAETVVTGTEEPERSRGVRIGLADVVVKLTGDHRVADDGRLAEALARAPALVAEFHYVDRMKDLPVRDEQGTRERPHFLRMRFDARAMAELLETTGLRPWTGERPLVIVRLAIRTARSQFVLTATGPVGRDQRDVLTEASQRRGVPIALPNADTAPTFYAVTAEALGSASPSARGPVLSGLLEPTDEGTWAVAWNLATAKGGRAWRMMHVSFDRALTNGIEIAALVLSGAAGP